MKTNFRNLLVAMALLFGAGALPVSAQMYQQMGFSMNGGYASYNTKAEGVRPGRGFNTGVGFNYELQFGHLLFDTGLGFSFTTTGMRVDSFSYMLPCTFVDSQNDEFKMRVITESRTDHSRVGNLQLPVMVGGLFGHFYFLGGVKLNVPMFGVTRVKADVTTMGYYDRYLQPIFSDDRHGFRTDVPVNIKGPKLRTSPVDVAASLELGFNYTSRGENLYGNVREVREARVRMAVYADYGLIPQNKNYVADPFTITADDGSEVQLGAEHILPVKMTDIYDIDRYTSTHILNTQRAMDTYMANFSVGIKVTVLFGSRQKFLCLSCESAVERGINNPGNRRRPVSNLQTEGRVRHSMTQNDNGR